ncbi:uncharacterized protein artn [Brachyhypopomus gauderio]|uniref:uncharacterized protein artn n=1 Tax=Brachyhypopomus gauderio TaxID=698409 RepID=UPI004041FE52
MTGEDTRVREDGKEPWHQEYPVSTSAQCHLRCWKVMIFVCMCLLGVADGGVAAEGREVSAPTGLNLQDIKALQHHSSGAQSRRPWALHDVSLAEEGEAYRTRWQRTPADPAPSRKPRPRKGHRGRKRQRSEEDCRLEKKQLRVRDLGLGYDSDEIVLFKFCAGTCASSRTNYDLALSFLISSGGTGLRDPSVRDLSTRPCCRPTRFETVSFMDARASWQTIRWLSAANCSCLG